MTKKNFSSKKYVVIYQSEEHFEVLGFITASSFSEAELKAQKELIDEAKYYNVSGAEIAELKDSDKIFFNI